MFHIISYIMHVLFLLFLICYVSSAAKHSLKFYYTASVGLADFPHFIGAAVFDDILVGYCDTVGKSVQPKQDWVEAFFVKEPQDLKWYRDECFHNQPNYFNDTLYSLQKRFNQSGGVHILQRMNGCEWDDETDEINAFIQYAYDGEDFIAFDVKTKSWIAPIQQAVIVKQRWDEDKDGIRLSLRYITDIFPMLLKKYVAFGKRYMQRTELPSVSLLQKTPSSPVSCHATGFYPARASLVWRKDREELHEGVDHGEILPNPDGTFQTSVDLDLSSVKSEEWSKYDCTFQLSGVKDDIVTKLETNKIRTNWGQTVSWSVVGLIAVGVLLFLLAFGLVIFYIRINNNNGSSEDHEERTSAHFYDNFFSQLAKCNMCNKP